MHVSPAYPPADLTPVQVFESLLQFASHSEGLVLFR